MCLLTVLATGNGRFLPKFPKPAVFRNMSYSKLFLCNGWSYRRGSVVANERSWRVYVPHRSFGRMRPPEMAEFGQFFKFFFIKVYFCFICNPKVELFTIYISHTLYDLYTKNTLVIDLCKQSMCHFNGAPVNSPWFFGLRSYN